MLRKSLIFLLLLSCVPLVHAAGLIIAYNTPDDTAAGILNADPRADFNNDGRTDARDIQAYVTQTLDPIARLKAHPDFPRLLESLNARMKWPAEKLGDTPEAMLATIDVCAQLHALTGEWPRPTETKPILRKIRDAWPLAFTDQQLTLWHIPTLARAATLSPTARADLEIPLRWCESRMTEPQIPFKPPTAILSASIGPGLRDLAMIRELLYGPDSAREVALKGFGNHPSQWGLLRIVDDCIDDFGLFRAAPAAFNHWAWTTRPALVWLLETKGFKRHLSPEQRAKWRRFYNLPCKMLCVGGKTLTIPGVNDIYSINPCIGPASAWTGDTRIDQWARWHARRQSGPSWDDLLVPADPPGYTPPERPPGCSGDRDFGRIKLTENETETRVEYLGDGDWKLTVGHNAGRALTLTMTAEVSP